MTAAPPLAGRTALVTGATGVIGSRVCMRLAELGASLLLHCRSSADAAQRLAGDRHRVVQTALPGAQGIAALRGAIEDAGGADILVNTVHLGSATAPAAEQPLDELRRHLESAVLHAELAALVVPGMRSKAWGRVVYVSGALMTRPAPGMSGYGAAKAAASTFTRYLALEEGRAGITANIVAPGRVVDPEKPLDLAPEWARLAEQLVARTALGRFPTPDDVAAAIVGLVLPTSAGVTGQTVWVTGGEPIA